MCTFKNLKEKLENLEKNLKKTGGNPENIIYQIKLCHYFQFKKIYKFVRNCLFFPKKKKKI